jgi:ATP-dependent HslUV protease ATP-binding subunit HslU
MVRTDHILFIAAGAFHVSKPSDLIPELQGRFPIRVELEALGREDFVRILTEPKERARAAVHGPPVTENVELEFTAGRDRRIADVATLVNDRTENIGARRLHTVMEKLLDEVSFDGARPQEKTAADRRRLRRPDARRDSPKNEDLSRYILWTLRTFGSRTSAFGRRSSARRSAFWRSARPAARRGRRSRR